MAPDIRLFQVPDPIGATEYDVILRPVTAERTFEFTGSGGLQFGGAAIVRFRPAVQRAEFTGSAGFMGLRDPWLVRPQPQHGKTFTLVGFGTVTISGAARVTFRQSESDDLEVIEILEAMNVAR